jgi:hypothetical protein
MLQLLSAVYPEISEGEQRSRFYDVQLIARLEFCPGFDAGNSAPCAAHQIRYFV